MTVRRCRERRPTIRALVVLAMLVLAGVAMPTGAATASPGLLRQAAPDGPDKIKPQLAQQLESKGKAAFWIRFETQADLTKASAIEDWTERGQAVYDALTSAAEVSQRATIAQLKTEGAQFQTFWATNAIRVNEGSMELAERLAVDPKIAALYPTRDYSLEKPTEGEPVSQVNSVEWGIANINADDVWNQYGDTGEGIVIASIDSGVQFDHPALANQYRGNNGDGTFDHNYNWFDAAGACGAAPCDRNGHGTHTMGTMLGNDGGSNQIGVAPGAKWIAANGCCPSDAALIASGQWMLAPTDLNGLNPRVGLRPHIINNSWGSTSPSDDPFMEDVSQAWAASGIFGVWANGNIGPACRTSGSPGSRALSYSVGAYDSTNAIAWFSSRGAGQDGEIKPNIAAPGVNVRSSLPNNGYGSLDGTSMATPHVAGTVALLWSAAPSLIGDLQATRDLLDGSAVDVDATECGGDTDDNNVFGEGRLDALAAVTAAPREGTGALTGTVVDTASGDPISGASVALTGGADRPPATATGADGTYEITHVLAGTYLVTASAFGYANATSSVDIVVGETATSDFTLDPLPTHPLTGTVRDNDGNAVTGARIMIQGTPLHARADATGHYTFDAVPEGTYTVTVSGGGCLDGRKTDIVVNGPETLDAQLAERQDAFGHTCRFETAHYVEATEGLPINGDDVIKKIGLPFAFPFYGDSYTEAYVSSNGFVSFQLPSQTNFCPVAGCNMRIPTRADPDAAIYAFWADLRVDVETGSQISTADLGDRFVIEWRNVHDFANAATRVDAEVVLHDDGQIVMQYRSLDTDWDRGGVASVGIEDATGSDAFEYSFKQPILTEDAIRFTPPPTGTLAGSLTDADTGLPLSGVSVTRSDARGSFRTMATGVDGTYQTRLPVGTWTIAFAKRGFVTRSHEVTVTESQRVTLNTALSPLLTAAPEQIEATAAPDQQRTIQVELTNHGNTSLDWQAHERTDTAAGPTATPQPKHNSADEPKILVYADWGYFPTPDTYVEQALRELGRPYTAFSRFDAFEAALRQGDWDLVVFAALGLPPSTTLDVLYEWVNDGGKLIIECHAMYALPGHPLWRALGVEYVADDRLPRQPVHWWAPGHPLFTGPHEVPEQTEYTQPDGSVDPNGQFVRALPGATPLAGYTEQPSNLQAAMVLANDDRTLFRGFTDWANINDLDADGVYDMVELWINSIQAIGGGFSLDAAWLDVAPASGRIDPGQSQTVEVTIDTTDLTVGEYTASIAVDGTTDANGTRLTIPVHLKVKDPSQNSPATGAPVVTTEGNDLLAEVGSIQDEDGLGAFSYQWQKAVKGGYQNITDAQAQRLTVTKVLHKSTVRVVVTFTDGLGHSETLVSAPKQVPPPGKGKGKRLAL